MDPDGFRLIRNRSERTVSSIMWQGIEKNAYVFNNKFPDGEVMVRCPRCNRDAMRYEDISENTRCKIYLDR
jgi:hypothetical protein